MGGVEALLRDEWGTLQCDNILTTPAPASLSGFTLVPPTKPICPVRPPFELPSLRSRQL